MRAAQATVLWIAALFSIAFILACGEASGGPGDGDLPADGDKPDGDGEPDGELEPDGDAADGDLLADGDAADDEAEAEAGDGDEFDAEADEAADAEPEIDWGEVDCDIAPPNYSCDPNVPESCQDGFCLFAMCIGGRHYDGRWADCGDGLCHPCEAPPVCPADCGQAPATTGRKEYVNDTTITVWVHGFSNNSPDELAQTVYGKARGCGGLLETMQTDFGVDRPCGDTPITERLPNHMIKVEYYGRLPDDWMTEADVAEVERYPWDQGPTLQRRYATIVAKFIRRRLDISGATHVNLTCHSMGCLIIRTMIENNLENLAAENRFVRWYTATGVIAGAQLARLSDNPTVQTLAAAIGLPLNDFDSMNPDNVQAQTAVWNRKLREGDSPYFAGMILHHLGATNPNIAEAMGFPLLEVNNPNGDPNDGIMFTDDEYFHSQRPEAALVAADGTLVASSHNFFYADHMTLPDTDTSVMLAAATLFGGRKVYLKLKSLELLKDRETHAPFDGENGAPPAELSVQTTVWYDPYVFALAGRRIPAHDAQLAHRVAPLWRMAAGETRAFDEVLFAAPVFDAMESFEVSLEFLEIDWDEHLMISEWPFDIHQTALSVDRSISLVDQTFAVESEYLRATFEVDVVPLY
ncbi:MAG: hypothetical protein C4523_03935 [Myxococcales bacterium]|nr:MAG: hypothetical protein C4523_03935 [Myxococcales bacterium]